MKVYTVTCQHYEGDYISPLVHVVATYSDFLRAVAFLSDSSASYNSVLDACSAKIETNPLRHSGRILKIHENESM